MVELAKGPVGRLLVLWIAVMVYCELRLTDSVPEEPVGLAFMFAAGIAIARMTPPACEAFRSYWIQRRKN